MNAPISTDDFRTLNRCLDDAIASAVTEYGLTRNQSTIDEEFARGNERAGFLAHQVRNLADTALLAFEALRRGNVGSAGSTAAVLHGSLRGIRALMNRSLADAHVSQPILKREKFLVSRFIEELAPAATLEANNKGITLTVMPVDDGVVIDGDRQVLAAVMGNLLQNAFKFTGPRSAVTLRVGTIAARVLIEVQDECGGLPDGNVTRLFRTFEELSADGSLVGLGLAFSRWGVEANDGRIYAHNLPEQGCVFTVDLPRLPVSLSG
jgi:signal transduction histidine kinase